MPEEFTADHAGSALQRPRRRRSGLRRESAARSPRVIVEPVVGNMGCVPPQPRLSGSAARDHDAHGALLIFDEVMTGFRVAYGGAQQLYGIKPDLTCLGKIIGGGLPVRRLRRPRARLWSMVAPARARVPGRHAFRQSARDGRGHRDTRAFGAKLRAAYVNIDETSRLVAQGVADVLSEAGVPVTVNRVGAMWTWLSLTNRSSTSPPLPPRTPHASASFTAP